MLKREKIKNSIEKIKIIPIVLFIFFIFIAIKSVYIVPIGHVGIKKYLGEVYHTDYLTEGWNIIIPIYTAVQNYNSKIISIDIGAAGASKDLQEVESVVAVQFSFLSNHSHFLQKIGTEETFTKAILLPAVHESVKAVSALFTAEELITRRSEVKILIVEQINSFLEKTLKDKELDKNSISIANVAITDFSFSDEFNRSIELKVRAEQQALQALNEKEKKITDAEAVAEKIRIESIAKANAIAREGAALRRFPELIKLKQVEAWDGVLPRVTGSYIPMLDIKEFKSQ